MARYTGPTERLSRRAGVNLFLKGERSEGPKSASTRRPYAPGQHGQSRRSGKRSDYGKQLLEKQKAKAIYGLLEKQFRRYYTLAQRSRGNSGERLLQLLELRLDNIVYRLGLADTRRQARQYVTHGLVRVDGVKASIPSMQMGLKQVVELVKIDRVPNKQDLPVWVRRAGTGLKGEIIAVPTREDIATEIEEQLIIEFYSR